MYLVYSLHRQYNGTFTVGSGGVRMHLDHDHMHQLPTIKDRWLRGGLAAPS